MAAALAVFALILWHRHQTSSKRLLAQAYTRERIFDLRMDGAGFAPVADAGHPRGDTTHWETASLLSARAAIERKLDTAPTDPHWLQLRARAQLMKEDFDAAIDVLDRLLGSGPVSASLLVDDASAYFERGTATGNENDYAATRVGPLYERAASIAQPHQYNLLTMRIQNQLGSAAVESGDAEDTWCIFMDAIRQL